MSDSGATPLLKEDLERAAARLKAARAAIFVEGTSDQAAVEAVAGRVGHDLVADRVAVIPIGGSSNIAHFLDVVHDDLAVAGLCDVAQQQSFLKALGTRSASVFACVEDLEDELIRAAGPESATSAIEAGPDRAAFHTFLRQPGWRDQPREAQIRRWLGAGSGRKRRYATRLVKQMDIAVLPAPLVGVLDDVARTHSS